MRPGRILVPRYGLPADDCAAALRAMGNSVATCDPDPAAVRAGARAPGTAAILSVNVHASYARAARESGCLYLAWILDPLVNWQKVPEELDSLGPHCVVGSYDPAQVEVYRASTARAVFHLPAGAHAARFAPADGGGKDGPPLAVSFVGSPLVRETNEFRAYRAQLEGRVRSGEDGTGYSAQLLDLCEAVVAAQAADPGTFRMQALFEEEERRRGIRLMDAQWTPAKRTFLMALAKEAASRGRTSIVNSLQGLDVWVFGPPEWKEVVTGTIRYGGAVDYGRDLPSVYRRTAANLNLTRLYAGDVVPPRVFEILACGGAVVTQDTPALAGLLPSGEGVWTFRTHAEMRARVEVILADPAAARAAAAVGRARVLAEHTLERRLAGLLERA